MYRDAHGLTQEQLAKAAAITARSYQNLEKGRANPTLQTIDLLAKALEVTASRLISLDHIRLSEPLGTFIAKFEKAFLDAPVGANLRDHDGVIQYRNRKFREFYHAPETSEGKVDLMLTLTGEARETLRSQLSAERRGMASCYVNYVPSPDGQAQLFYRFYPCQIRSQNGSSTYLSAEYVAPVCDDCQKNYYQFCAILLNCLDRD